MATKAGSSAEKLGFLGNYSWVIKVFASATSIVAGLVGFGFFSEAALYEMAGLPRLSADPVYLAEAGARALVSAIGAVGVEGGSVLLAALSGAFWLWSVKSREATKRLLQVPVLLLSAQVLVLAAAVVLLGSLVGVARMGTSAGRDQVAERAKQKIAELRDREDWTPTAELEAVEMLRIAPNRFAATSQDVGAKLRWVLPPWRDYPLKAQPSLGFPLRPTAELRREARDYFGWLAVGAILLPGAFVLLQRWRANIAARHLLALREFRVWRRRKKLEAGGEVPAIPDPEDPTAWGVGLARRETWAAYFEASRFLLEPVLIMLSVCCVGLIPSAHGVLAEESIGLQPVMVRLVVRQEGRGGDADTTAFTEAPRESGGVCSASALEGLDRSVSDFRRAWQAVSFLRVSEGKDFEDAFSEFRRRLEILLGGALKLRCPEALRRLWRLAPEPSEFEAQPRVAGYFAERFGEAVLRDGFSFYGHLLAAPRGEEKGHLTLFNQFGPDRWAVREVPRDQVAEILLLPREREILVDDAVAAIRSTFVPERLDELGLNPGVYALEQSLKLLGPGTLPHNAQARLLTILGSLGRTGTAEASALRKQVVDEVLDVLEQGLEAAQTSSTAENGPQVDLAGTAATSLAAIGGPYAARRLAKLLVERKLSPDHVNAVPTLVTSAGMLASDLRESREVFLRRELCDLEAREGLPALPSGCSSGELEALADLIVFMSAAVKSEASTLDVRTAACTGLGRTLHHVAQMIAFDLGIEAVQRAEDDLAGHCLVHAPSRLKNDQRAWLRAIARGQRSLEALGGSTASDVAAKTSRSLPPVAPSTKVPDSLRRAAFDELWEGGLWKEEELVFDLLGELPDGELFDRVEASVEDVAPEAAIRKIESCLEQVPVDDTSRLRCARAAGILHRTEEGDNGLTRKTLQPLVENSELPSALRLTAAVAIARLAERGGREAKRVRDSVSGNSELEFELAGELHGLLSRDAKRWAPLAADVFLAMQAGIWVQTAAKFLEDGPAGELEPKLLGCLVQGGRFASRCALGLALLDSSWQHPERTRSVLASAMNEGNPVACVVMAELAARGNEEAKTIASEACPQVVEALVGSPPEVRWAMHVLALIGVLDAEGVSPL